MPTLLTIANAQSELLQKKFGYFNADDFAHTCWACGKELRQTKAFRAHIVSRANGGSDDATNYFILCRPCHESQPDGLTPEFQTRWLLEHPSEVEIVSGEIQSALAKIEDMFKEFSDPKDIMNEFFEYLNSNGGTMSALKSAATRSSGVKNLKSNILNAVREKAHFWIELNSHRIKDKNS